MEGYDVDFFEIHYLFRDLIRAFMKRINEQGEEAIRITHEQFGFLYAISKNKNDVIQQDMAEFMKKDKSVILRTIDSLEEKNLIRRVVSKNDRRKNCLMVTKAGTRVIENYLKIGKEIVNEIHEGISEVDLKIFYKVVRQFKDHAGRL